MTGRDGGDAIAGGPARHVPVLLDEVLEALEPRSGSVFIDCTFGAGGYSRALVDRGARVIAIDRDPQAIAAGAALAAASGGRLTLIEGRFGELDKIARQEGHEGVDGVALDIGVSSMQIDEAERGFSFLRSGPLDMRMEAIGPTAADVVNRAEVKDLTRIIGLLGEERNASRLARAIAERRKSAPIHRTNELATLAEATVGRRPGERIHPATRLFQALRMFVNRELEQLAAALLAAERILVAGGKLAVVTFHSLEDRMVKRFFADRSRPASGSRYLPQARAIPPTFEVAKRAAVSPGADEIAANPRARSAHLRFGTRTDADARPESFGWLSIPSLPDPSRYGAAAS